MTGRSSKTYLLLGIIAIFQFECDDTPDCYESICYNAPRICIEIIPYSSEQDVCDQVDIVYSIQGDDENYPEEQCGSTIFYEITTDHFRPTSCFYGSAEVTVTHNGYSASELIEDNKFNYCGRDIAYVVVTLHEDGPPTFGDPVYVSPCEKRGL